MIISNKNISIGKNFILSILLAGIFLAMHTTGYYSMGLRAISAFGLIPVICCGLILLQTREIRIVVIALVLYQTWNMFLDPYLWKEPVESIYRVYSESDFPAMATASALSIYAIFGGFFWALPRIKVKPIFEPNYMNRKKLEKLLIYMIIGGYLVGVGQGLIAAIGLPLGFLGLIDTMLPATVGALTLLYFLRGGKNVVIISLTAIYMIYYFIYYVGGTLFIYSIFLIMAPTVVYIIERKKIPYLAVGLVVLLALPIYMSRHAYRNAGLYSTGSERMAVGMSILEKEYSNVSLDHWQELYEAEQEDKNVDNRTEGVSYLGQIVKKTRSGQCRYLYGETLAWLPTMVLPHFLIPFRPGQNMGDQWAIYYGLKDKSWRASINFPMLCEFYANFGYLGMIILSFFNGILIVWFMRIFNNGFGDTNLLLLIFVVSRIIVVEANVTLAYGAILQVIAVCWLYKRYFKKA